jgi:hypothetical protein
LMMKIHYKFQRKNSSFSKQKLKILPIWLSRKFYRKILKRKIKNSRFLKIWRIRLQKKWTFFLFKKKFYCLKLLLNFALQRSNMQLCISQVFFIYIFLLGFIAILFLGRNIMTKNGDSYLFVRRQTSLYKSFTLFLRLLCCGPS